MLIHSSVSATDIHCCTKAAMISNLHGLASLVTRVTCSVKAETCRDEEWLPATLFWLDGLTSSIHLVGGLPTLHFPLRNQDSSNLSPERSSDLGAIASRDTLSYVGGSGSSMDLLNSNWSRRDTPNIPQLHRPLSFLLKYKTFFYHAFLNIAYVIH